MPQTFDDYMSTGIQKRLQFLGKTKDSPCHFTFEAALGCEMMEKLLRFNVQQGTLKLPPTSMTPKSQTRSEKNHSKIILDLCGGTGAWSKPYKDAGYDVRIITLPRFDLFLTEFDEEFVTFHGSQDDDADKMTIKMSEVHGVLFAPTCTMFSLARTTAKTPRDFNGAMALVEVGLGIIWRIRIANGIKFWALENPMGYLRQFLGKPPLTFDPSDYGASYTKRTDLWGFYNPPRKSKRKLTQEELARCAINNRVLPDLPQDYVLPNDFKPQQARRSMTDEHFAQAFFNANP